VESASATPSAPATPAPSSPRTTPDSKRAPETTPGKPNGKASRPGPRHTADGQGQGHDHGGGHGPTTHATGTEGHHKARGKTDDHQPTNPPNMAPPHTVRPNTKQPDTRQATPRCRPPRAHPHTGPTAPTTAETTPPCPATGNHRDAPAGDR
jgi:hypothetical protein